MNIKEVAKRAKVSTATVSRTINNSDKVRPGTAARVRKAIEELNFYPNTHARTLVSGRSRMLGLIISDITNPFFPELVKSFEDQAVQRGQEVIIGNTDYNPKRMAGCIRRMVERKVDGVAIMTSEADPGLVAELARRNIPTVFMDTGKAGPHTANIRIDYAQGIHEAMQHLFSTVRRQARDDVRDANHSSCSQEELPDDTAAGSSGSSALDTSEATSVIESDFMA